jgi:phosphoglycolate phosphatase
MKFRAALFDLDGTLIDTIDDLADSMNIVLKKYGFPVHDVEQYKYFVGDGIDVLVKRAIPSESCGDEELVSRCIQAMKEEYSLRWANKSRPYEGIPELLDAFIGADIKLSVLSNKPHDPTKVVVSTMLNKWKFEMVVGVKDGVPKKPDPAAAIMIAENLGIPPRDFIYIGDTHTDMQTALSAGMFPVGALWGFRTGDELISAGARILVKNPADLLKFI